MKRDGLAATVVQFQGLKGRGEEGGGCGERKREIEREAEK